MFVTTEPTSRNRHLKPENEEIIKATLPAVGENIGTIAKTFYRTMFGKHPELLANTFNRGNQKSGEQQKALAASVATFASMLVNPDAPDPVDLLKRIGHKDKVAGFIDSVKRGEGRLMGFGHRVYKNYDPRARVIKKLADQVFEVTGRNPLLDIALELEKIALEDEYFVKRKLYPNVDFYSGLIYQAMGFPVEMFPVLFAIPRTVGWLAQWEEMLNDGEQKIARPRQVYQGSGERAFVPMSER